MFKLSKTDVHPQQTQVDLDVPSLFRGYASKPLPSLALPTYTNADIKEVAPNTEGVAIKADSIAPVVPTLDSVIRKTNLPSYIPSDTPAGLIGRDDWDNFDDVNFYVGTDGKYYSTDPFFNRMIWRESKHDLNAKNGVFRGPTQIGKLAWTDAMPGISFDLRTDPEYAGKGAVNYAKWNIKQLKRAGIPVNTFTVYGAHNLGIGNLMTIYRDLDAPLTGKAKDAVLNNFKDSKYSAPELYTKYIRDPNSITGRDYMNLINAIFTNKE